MQEHRSGAASAPLILEGGGVPTADAGNSAHTNREIYLFFNARARRAGKQC